MSGISGRVDPAFAQVREVFAANFSQESAFPEVGAGFCVYAGGKEVVDLWGGVADQATGRPWTNNTLVHVFSTSKAFSAIAVAQLVDAGKLSYTDRVAQHWPEFAAAGKESVTIGHVLSHQSGLNAFDAPTSTEDLADWDLIVGRLAQQAPFCKPGEETAYHAITLGYLAMEIVRRVTGLMPRDYVGQRIAAPLGADLYVGALEADWGRVASLIPPPPPPANRPPMHPQAMKAIANPMITPPLTATSAWRLAQIPAVNGHVSAKGIARLWAAIAHGSLEGAQLLSAAAIEGLRAPLSTRPDLMMGPGAWGAGVLINRGGLFGPRERTFGNCGFGGSFGFADPELDVAAGYTPNRLFPSVLQDPRAMALANAVIACAGKAGS